MFCLCWVYLLEQYGVIDGYVVLLNFVVVDLKFMVFVRVILECQDKVMVEYFVCEIEKVFEVFECYLMVGSYDYFLCVIVWDFDDYQCFQMEMLMKIKGVCNVEIEILFKCIKQMMYLLIQMLWICVFVFEFIVLLGNGFDGVVVGW